MCLEELIARAVEDPSLEGEVFRHLLQATLFVHSPKLRSGPRLSVVQFKTPHGVMAIPVFTDRRKAEFAGGKNVRIVPVAAKELFSATLGATVVINPNDAWCILYPEEIIRLLQGQSLAAPPVSLTLPTEMQLRKPAVQDSWLTNLIVESLSAIEEATDAWLTEAVRDVSSQSEGYVLVIAANKAYHERIARSITLAFSEKRNRLGVTFDVTFLDSAESRDEWLTRRTDCLVYRRDWLQMLDRDSAGSA